MRATNLSSERLLQLLLGMCLVFLVVAAGLILGQTALDVQFIIALGGGVVVFGLLFNGDRARWLLMCLALATLAFGHRGIYLGYWTYFVPLEVVGWSLAAVLLANTVLTHSREQLRVPASLILVSGWAVIGGIAVVLGGGDLDIAAAWVLPLVFGVPAFVAVYFLVKEEVHVDQFLKIILGVAVVVSILGLLEYAYPAETTRIAPWFFVDQTLPTQDGFVRAVFGFWGYPSVGSIIAWGSYIAFLNVNVQRPMWRWINGIAFMITLVGVYISGERAAWVSLGLGIVLIALSLRAYGWLAAGAIAFTSGVLPSEFWNRVQTITSIVIRGEALDTSIGSRIARWQWGIETTIENPLWGSGFGHWLTHNEFLEISSTIGIIPSIIFAVFVIALIVRIVRFALRAPSEQARQIGWLFTAFVANWIVQLLVETDMQNPTFAAPFWILVAVAWFIPDIYAGRGQPAETKEAYTPRPASAFGK